MYSLVSFPSPLFLFEVFSSVMTREVLYSRVKGVQTSTVFRNGDKYNSFVLRLQQRQG